MVRREDNEEYDDSVLNVTSDCYYDGYWQNEKYFIEVKDKLPLGHSEKSLFIAQKFFEIPENVAVAIRWHMGFSDSSFIGGNKSIGFAFKEYPLSLLLYIADLKATIMDEQ